MEHWKTNSGTGTQIWPMAGLISNDTGSGDLGSKLPKKRVAKRNKWAELHNKRILIVEDEPMQALHLANIVNDVGAEVAGIATSIQAALAEISATPFDCATLDLNLHGFFSLGMVKGLRDMGIPFVVCTAYGERVESLGGAPVIEKPVTEVALAEALCQAMRGR
jgi:CheY-like chemotaxis protein